MARDPRELERLASELASFTAEERARVLAAMVRRSAPGSDGDAYRAVPPGSDEFSTDNDPLAWEAEGWEEFAAPR